jgi:hypothetical protein
MALSHPFREPAYRPDVEASSMITPDAAVSVRSSPSQILTVELTNDHSNSQPERVVYETLSGTTHSTTTAFVGSTSTAPMFGFLP